MALAWPVRVTRGVSLAALLRSPQPSVVQADAARSGGLGSAIHWAGRAGHWSGSVASTGISPTPATPVPHPDHDIKYAQPRHQSWEPRLLMLLAEPVHP